MGLYTEFVFKGKLKKETPKEVLFVLGEIIDNQDIQVSLLDYKEKADKEKDNNILFKCERWRSLGNGVCSLEIDYDYFHELKIDCELKNYDEEIDRFINWIGKYMDEFNTFVGYYLYEEADSPTLLFYDSCEEKIKKEYIEDPGYL